MATEHMASQERVVQSGSAEPQDDVDVEAIPPASEATEQAGQDATAARRDKRDDRKEGTTPREREQGKTVLPFSRVQKIIKADKDLPMVARDATFLIALATEEFIKRLSQACQRLAEREKRSTVQQKDVASIVRRVDEFLFLEEIIGSQESTGRRRLQKSKVDIGAPGDQGQLQSTLGDFVQATNDSSEDARDINNVVTDEDGTMYAE